MIRSGKARAARAAVWLLLLLAASVALAQTPTASPGVPTESFLGEPFCFDTNLSNVGAPGYGPYLRLVIPATLSFDSAEIFESPLTVVQNSVFPAGGTLTDPLIIAPTSNIVNGNPGDRLVILQLPVGSITAGGPPLESVICLTIQPSAPVGTPIPVSITPAYQFGNTPTGANGSIIGTPPAQTVTPTVILFEKDNTAPESERPPGAVWPYEYVLTVDIANTATINPLVVGDTLPADVQYVGPVSITGGSGCAVTNTPSTITPGGTLTVTCTGATTGTVSDADVVVRFPVHIVDTLDESICATETQTNAAVVNATYVPAVGAPQALPVLNDVSEVVAKHVAVQKGVSPDQGSPGTAVTYTLQFQTTQFGTTSALSIVDILPDGIDFDSHGSLTVGGSPFAIAPVVVPGVNDSVSYDIRAAFGADIAPGTAITLTYTGTVRQLYESAGTPPVLAADPLTNTVVATYSLVEGANGCSDGSAASFIVDPVDIVKSLLTPGPFVPGDFVIFRLAMSIPSGDTQNVIFRDFFPLPVFDVATMNLTYSGPDVFRAVGGANADTMNLTPVASIDTATNSLTLTYPNINTTEPQTVAVDVRVQVQPDAFADNLFLTNIFRASSSNTADVEANDNAPVQIRVRSPALALTKGVLSTNGNGSIAPGPVAPVNGNLSGADAGDSVVYRITVENRGGAPAYDVVVTDPGAAGLTGCAVTSTQLASGGALTSSGSLATGLTLTNGAAGNPVLTANDGSLGVPFGADTAFVDVSCTLAASVAPNQTIANTAQATWKPQPLGTPGVETFPPVSDSAIVSTAIPTFSKSLVATSEASTAGNRLAIGEIARYRLAIAIPEGTIADFRVQDLVPTGMAFLNDGSARAVFVTNSGSMAASGVPGIPTVAGNAAADAATPLAFALPAGAIQIGNSVLSCAPGASFGSGTDPCFRFGNITNTGSDSDAEFLVIEYNAILLNIGMNSINNNRDNRARMGSGTSQYGSDSNSVRVISAAPSININKTVTPTGGDAGDVLTYTINLSNGSAAGNSTAFEAVLVDVIPAGLTLVGGSFTNAPPTGGATVDSTSVVGNTLGAQLTLPAGGAVQFTYQVTVDNSVAPGTQITNTANLTYTSLPGSNGTAGNATGSTTPGTPGSDTGERTGSGSGPNNYSVSDPATVTISSVTLQKQVIASSLPYTGIDRVRPAVTDLAIGETATFRILATIPEGTTPEVTITDVVPFSNGTMEVLGGSVIAVSPGLSPAVPNPAPVISDGQLGDGINDTIRFSFGQVLNPAPNGPGTIEIEVVARLVDVVANQNADQLTNNASVQFGPGLNGTASAPLDVVEPRLDVVKSSPTSTGQAGEVVPYTVTVSHNGASNMAAQAVLLSDLLPTPAGLNNLVFGSAVTSGTCLPAPVIDSSATSAAELLVEVDQLPLDCTLTVTYSATLENTVQVGTDVVNNAELAWHSIDPDGVDGGFGRDYSSSDPHEVLISSPGVIKNVTATSAASTGDSQIDPTLLDLTIGETVTYQFSVVLPSGVSPGAVAVDQLPTGSVSMQVISSQILSVGSAISPAPVVGSAGVAADGADADAFDDRVTWTLGTLEANPGAPAADRTLQFEVVAQVMDTAQTDGGVTVRNTASFTTDTAGTINGSADVDIVEPRLALAKSITSPAAPVIVQAGAQLDFEIELSHIGGAPAVASAADAFNIVVSDTLPNPGVGFDIGSVGGTCAGIVADDSAYPLVTFEIAELDLTTASCTITYSGTVTNTVTPSTTYTNSAVAEFDSLPVPEAGATRTGTTNTDADDFTILGPSLVKVAVDSDLPSTGAGVADPLLLDLAIGETVSYTLTIGFPEGTVVDAILIDNLPTAPNGVLEAIGASVSALGNGGISTTLPGTPVFTDDDVDGRNDTITFDFGTISNPSNGNLADDFIQVEVVARVVDVPVNSDGLVLINSAVFTSATTVPVVDDADVEVVEPELAIDKSMGPVVGAVVTIDIELTNNGNAPAHNIAIEDVLNDSLWQPGSVVAVNVPAGFLLSTQPGPGPGDTTIRIVTDPTAVLPAGSIASGDALAVRFTATLTDVPPTANPVPNTATNTGASSIPDAGNPDNREYDDVDDAAQLGLPDPQFRKTYSTIDNDASGDVSPGDTVVFSLTIDNSAGLAPLTGIVIDDLVPLHSRFDAANSNAGWTGCADGAAAGALCSITVADIAAGASSSVAFAVNIDDPLPAGVDSIANQALLGSNEVPDDIPSDDPVPPGEEDETIVPIVAAPQLTLTKVDDVADGSQTAPGAVIVYTLEYANIGNQAATGVFLTDTVPASTSYNAAASAPDVWSCLPDASAGSTCTLPVGALPVGDVGTASFAVTVDDPVPAGLAAIENAALVEDDDGNSDDADETTPLDAVPGLNISKTDGDISTVPGGTVAWTLSYWNDGDQDASGVVITETVPANTTFNPGASTAGWVCAPNNNPGSSCTLFVGTLPGQTTPAGALTATFAVTVAAQLPAGIDAIFNSVLIADDDGGSDTGGDDTPVNAAPDLTLTKDDGGATVSPGGAVAWTLSYANVGNQGATGVVISEIVPASTSYNPGASSAGWTCAPDNSAGSLCSLAVGAVGAGASGSRTFAVTVDNPVPAGLEAVDNTAVVADDGSNGPDPTPDDNTDSDDTPLLALPVLVVDKDDGGISTQAGGTVVWTLTYQNTGDQAASGVVLSDTVPVHTTFNAAASLPSVWTCADGAPAGTLCETNVGTVAAGAAAASVAFAVTVDATVPAGVEQLDNTVLIASDGSGGEGTDPQDSDSDVTPLGAAPDLTLSKSDGGSSGVPDGAIAYTLTFQNVGSQDATGVVISETVPLHTSFDATGSSAGWICVPDGSAGSSCTLAIGNIAAGAPADSVVFSVIVDNPLADGVTEVVNSGSIVDDGSNGPDPTPENNVDDDNTPIAAGPDLTLLKSDGDATGSAGGVVVYTLTYQNVGTQDATGVVINETVPDNSSFDAAASSAGWSCADGAPAGSACTLAIGNVAAAASAVSVGFAVRLPDPIPAGVESIDNSATIADDGSNGEDPTPDNNTDADETPLAAAPDLSVVKTDGDVMAEPGGVVVYSLAYANNGDQDASGVTLTEAVPANTSFAAAGSSAGWSCVDGAPAGTACELAVGTLAAGDGGVASFAVMVDDPLSSGVLALQNTVSIGDDGAGGPDPTPDDNSDDETTPLGAMPDLVIVKSAAEPVAVAGGQVAYTLSYSNVGNQDATGVVITETVPQYTRFVAAGSSAGWSCADNAPAGSVCLLSVGKVSAGDPAVGVTFVVAVDTPLPAEAGAIDNLVSIADDGSNGPDPSPEDNSDDETTPVTTAPDLTIEKATDATEVDTDDEVVYTLTYRNIGARDATGVVITETVPVGTVFVSAGSTPGWSCADGATAGTECLLEVGDVPADGSSASVTFVVRVTADADEAIGNTVSITDDGDGGPDPTPDNNVDVVGISVNGLPPALPEARVVPATDMLAKLLLLLSILGIGVVAVRRRQ